MRSLIQTVDNIQNENNDSLSLETVIEFLRELKSDLMLYDDNFDSMLNARGIDGSKEFVRAVTQVYDDNEWYINLLAMTNEDIKNLQDEVKTSINSLNTRLNIGLE